MKRMVSLVLVLLLTLLNLSAFATVEQITSVAQEPGYENILFRNGYRGFCVDEGLDGALVGDVFEMIPASYTAANDGGGRIIDQYIKTLIVECFDDLFAVQADGTYAMTTDGQWLAQRVIWHYTDGYTRTDESQQAIQQMVEKVDELVAAGEEIPDDGHVKQLNDETLLRFDFALFQTRVEGQQCFFGYQVTDVTQGSVPPTDQPIIPDDGSETPVEPSVETPLDPSVQPPINVDPGPGPGCTGDKDPDEPQKENEIMETDTSLSPITPTDIPPKDMAIVDSAQPDEIPQTGDAFGWWAVVALCLSVPMFLFVKAKKED